MRKLTQMQYIERVKIVHNNQYDYSLTKYINTRSKIEVICKEHGVFSQNSKNHLDGQGCPQCKFNKRLFLEDFLEKSKQIHGDKYDYSSTVYSGYNYYVEIICRQHGAFKQKPAMHYNGQGCPKCANNIRKSLEQFTDEAKLVHGNKYDYENSIYKSANEKMEIVCKKHGSFLQKPANHLNGEGCPCCKNSKGEERIENFIQSKSIKFVREKRFEKCRDSYTLPFDFYLPEYNLCIEYDGIQHFKPIEYFGGEKAYLDLKKRDKIKNEFCKKHNIYLLRISYKQKNIEKIIEKHVQTGSRGL